jgi:hypothetical protein
MWKKENGAIYTIKEETFPANKKLAIVAWLLEMIDYNELIREINSKVTTRRTKVSISN